MMAMLINLACCETCPIYHEDLPSTTSTTTDIRASERDIATGTSRKNSNEDDDSDPSMHSIHDTSIIHTRDVTDPHQISQIKAFPLPPVTTLSPSLSSRTPPRISTSSLTLSVLKLPSPNPSSTLTGLPLLVYASLGLSILARAFTFALLTPAALVSESLLRRPRLALFRACAATGEMEDFLRARGREAEIEWMEAGVLVQWAEGLRID
jgi:hypothetical protein